MDSRVLRVTQTEYFSLLTYPKLLLASFCYTFARIGECFLANRNTWKCTDAQTEVKVEIVIQVRTSGAFLSLIKRFYHNL